MSVMDERIKYLEHRMQVLTKEMNEALNELATAVSGIMKVNRMYQVSTQEQFEELRKHTGLVTVDIVTAHDEQEKEKQSGTNIPKPITGE